MSLHCLGHLKENCSVVFLAEELFSWLHHTASRRREITGFFVQHDSIAVISLARRLPALLNIIVHRKSR
jgi:hypothetical protein